VLPTWALDPPKVTGSTPVAAYSGFSAPAKALYDPQDDRYLVSNLNGDPLSGSIWGRQRTNHGFISVLSPDGTVRNRTWIEDGKRGARLDAPKGLGIAGGLLYVADITVVRVFDVQTGAPRGDIPLPGAIATRPDGAVYVATQGYPTAPSRQEGPTPCTSSSKAERD
jgi:hypothetical protein